MGQTLSTLILINAKAGSGFAQVGNTLMTLGAMVSQISDKLIAFGEDSVKVYRNYEKSMTDAKVALSTIYGRNTRELETVMNKLDEAATEWAATTIFHTNDVGNAISEAAHAGWDFEEIMTGLPLAIKLAQAGNMDLSDSVDYVVKSTNAAGVSFADMENFLDMWVMSANKSASTVSEFGDAMLQMGSTMQFSGNTAELMTMIAVMANAGTVGSEAGTMVRNSMLRLAAPTNAAEEAMAGLGATSEEIAAIMGDVSVEEANAMLAAQGFSAYYTSGPNQGQLRNMVDIYKDMYEALGQIAGGYENISKNDQSIGILKAIFGQRSITGALNMIKAAATDYGGLYDELMNGDATGYLDYASQTMMDTLDGSIETYESKVERLKQLVGEELKPQVEAVTGFFGDVADKISGLDDGKFSALVHGLEVIAAAGPGLIGAGIGLRAIGYMLSPLGAAATGVIALATAAEAIKAMNEVEYSGNFGTMALDVAAISTAIGDNAANFTKGYEETNKFREALDKSIESYKTASSYFSSDLFTHMMTGNKLTESDIQSLENLGVEMYDSVMGAISTRAATDVSYWEMLFGGAGVADENPYYQEIVANTETAFNQLSEEVSKNAEGLKEAMHGAFADGEITEAEYQEMVSYFQAYNEAVERASIEAQMNTEIGKILYKAQTASLESVQELSEQMNAAYQPIIDLENGYFENAVGNLIMNGASQEAISAAEAAHQERVNQYGMEQAKLQQRLWESAIRSSDQGQYYDFLEGLAGQYVKNGIGYDAISAAIIGRMGMSAYAGDPLNKWLWSKDTDREQAGRMFREAIDAMGGPDKIQGLITSFEQSGDTETAESLQRFYAMEELLNGFTRSGDSGAYLPGGNQHTDAAILPGEFSAQEARSFLESVDYDGSLRTFFKTRGEEILSGTFFTGLPSQMSGQLGEIYNQTAEQMKSTYDFARVLADSTMYDPGRWGAGEFAMYDLLYGEASTHAEDYRITIPADVDVQGMDEMNMEPVPLPITPHVEGEDSMQALQDQGVTVEVDGDTAALTATIDAEDGQTLLEYVNGDASNLAMTIYAEDGKTVLTYVNGDASALAAAISSFNGQTITVNISGRRMFADGGRATSASIFGEAGPEWAIPEQHSERTAELLNAARAASGFTWGDLLSRFGGLNANPTSQTTTFVYSPVIHAQDASGVEEVLRADKARMEKWFEEKQMRDRVEVYS